MIRWNKLDVARDNLLTTLEKPSEERMFSLLELALQSNRPEFVALFLQTLSDQKFPLKSFLTQSRLLSLYQVIIYTPYLNALSIQIYNCLLNKLL